MTTEGHEDHRLALYGSLYLDRGERMPKAHEQIAELKKQVTEEGRLPAGFFFDLVYRAKDASEEQMARRYAEDIETAVHEAFADVETAEGMPVYIAALPVTSRDKDPQSREESARSAALKSLRHGAGDAT